MLEFRNYRALSWSPAPHLNVIAGLNAQGKTNLLEALGFVVTGRSFRTSRTADLARWGSEAATLSGDLIRGETKRTVRRGLSRRDDGTWQATGESSPEWARAIAFGWPDLEIVNGAPAARRHFIDGFAARLYTNHAPTLVRFRQILARRNRLLQQRPVDAGLPARLGPWNEQFATVGMELLGRRRKAVAALQTELARVYAALSGARSKVEIRYRTALGEAAEPAALLTALERSQRDEIR
ncbi:MAG: DNA replication/repair protein RecF, partial [Candidatus Rokuibacteriota bacterium]